MSTHLTGIIVKPD